MGTELCPQVSTWRQGHPRDGAGAEVRPRGRAALCPARGQRGPQRPASHPFLLRYVLCDLDTSHNLSEPQFPHPLFLLTFCGQGCESVTHQCVPSAWPSIWQKGKVP